MAAHARPRPATADPRWERTRRALLDAGRELFGRRGVEATTVLEIVRVAGVSQPSFYNHFPSKEALVEAVAADLFERDVAVKVAAFRSVADPAEGIAANVRHTLRVARQDAAVAWVMVRSGAMRDLRRAGGPDDLAAMIAAGVRAGRFRVPDPAVAAAVIRGAAFPLLQDILHGRAPADVEAQFAELVLRMLGLPVREAARVAARAAGHEHAAAAAPARVTDTARRTPC